MRLFGIEWLKTIGRSSTYHVVDQGLRELMVIGLAQDFVANGSKYSEVGHLMLVVQDRKSMKALDQLLQSNGIAAEAIGWLPPLALWGVNRYANLEDPKRHRQFSLSRLAMPRSRSLVILADFAGCLQLTQAPEILQKQRQSLVVGEDLPIEDLLAALADLGYIEVELVQEVGDFAVRGGIVDIFSPHERLPLRLEWIADRLKSIKLFEPASQRSQQNLDHSWVFPAFEVPNQLESRLDYGQRIFNALLQQDVDRFERQALVEAVQKGRSFSLYPMFHPLFLGEAGKTAANYLTEVDTVVLFDSLPQCRAEFRKFYELQLSRHAEDERDHKPTITPEAHWPQVKTDLGIEALFPVQVTQLRTGTVDPEQASVWSGRSEFPLRSKLLVKQEPEVWLDLLATWVNEDFQIMIISHTKQQMQRVASLFTHRKVATRSHEVSFCEVLGVGDPEEAIQLALGDLSEWTWVESSKTLIVPDFYFFGLQKRKRHVEAVSGQELKALLDSFRNLEPGSIVVHIEHGIGRFQSIQTLQIGGVASDFLIIEYAGNDKVYVPVDRLNLVQKYAGGGAQSNPSLDRLKSQGWLKRKSKVKKAVQDLTEQLLKVQAQRKVAKRPSYSEPGDLYASFESDFPYDETADQWKAIQDVNEDLIQPEPMDRLICGDVGFGKTEVALRAAMRVVTDGFQVLVLAPTTVLSYQHYKTFQQRFEHFGISVGLLNRFVKGKTMKTVRDQANSGKIDILIGTHRLLSKDVSLPKLGLIIVDEEQRFGVGHKELIKNMRASCDILTLTATPIPRSLHMAMLGLRNISIITTPPMERMAIKTMIVDFDANLIRQGVEQELKRGGQVFFVHNRVENILEISAFLREILPNVEVRIAHGQMSENELESVMIDFIEQRFPVLLCTTIIESGLDIPNVNTIFVNHAERFGLAQLYQMRGRVGRSSRQSYAYFIVNHRQGLRPDAEKRLEILAAHQELGSGFHIANYDLEMRGAGNLLGSEQSGHVADVGFELYTDMLQEEIERQQGHDEYQPKSMDTELKIPLSCTIPVDYIASQAQRLAIYRKLFSAADLQSIDDIQSSLSDRYGELPEECANIFAIARLKLVARACRLAFIAHLGQGLWDLRFYPLSEQQIANLQKIASDRPSIYQVKSNFGLFVQVESTDSPGAFSKDDLDAFVSVLEPIRFAFEVV